MQSSFFLAPQPIGWFSKTMQIALVVLLLVTTVFVAFWEYDSVGTMWGYPFSISILFVALYEELIFRGFVLGALLKRTSAVSAVIISSILFGLWHAKNLLWVEPALILRQILYTGLIVGPILAFVTVKTRSIWPAIILHQLHNILASPVVHDILRS